LLNRNGTLASSSLQGYGKTFLFKEKKCISIIT